MQISDKIKSLYIDCRYDDIIKADDFIVTIGKRKSNSVYHVARIKSRKYIFPDKVRYYMEVLVSDLITCLGRDRDQALIPMVWYSRDKKKMI